MKLKYIFSISILMGGLILPSQADEKAFPRAQGYVSDFAGILGGSNQSLSSLLTELDQKAKAQVALVTVPEMGGETIETYAVDLFKEWGIGSKETDRGVLILLSLKERRVRIEVGYGLEGVIPDGLAGEIIQRDMIPFFKQQDYKGGLLAGTSRVVQIIARDAQVTLSGRVKIPPRTKGRSKSSILNIIILIIIILLSSFSKRRRGRSGFYGGYYGGGGGGGFGGGFGGFGGGGSGGGGASGGW